jgi:hypothetical protein
MSDQFQPTISNPGQRYNLGYVQGQCYAIWDRNSGQLLQQFPLSDQGWATAWQWWSSWEAQVAPLAAPSTAGAPTTIDPVSYPSSTPAATPIVAPSAVPSASPAPSYQPPAVATPSYQPPASASPSYPAQTPGTYPGHAGPIQTVKTNGLAVASLVLGILWLYWVGAVLAVVFGYMAKQQIDQSHGAQTGRGMAIAGIVLGWIWLGFLVIAIIAVAANP